MAELMRFRVARAPLSSNAPRHLPSKEKEQHHTSLTYRE